MESVESARIQAAQTFSVVTPDARRAIVPATGLTGQRGQDIRGLTQNLAGELAARSNPAGPVWPVGSPQARAGTETLETSCLFSRNPI